MLFPLIPQILLTKMQAGQEQDGLPRRARGPNLVHREVNGEQGHRIDVGPSVDEEGESQGIAILTGQEQGEQSRGISAQLGNESA